jgi:hypothetical protein
MLCSKDFNLFKVVHLGFLDGEMQQMDHQQAIIMIHFGPKKKKEG